MPSSVFWSCALVLTGEHFLVCAYTVYTVPLSASLAAVKHRNPGRHFLTREMLRKRIPRCIFNCYCTTRIFKSQSQQTLLKKLKVVLEVLQSYNRVISEIKVNKTIEINSEIKVFRGVSILPPARDAFLYNRFLSSR